MRPDRVSADAEVSGSQLDGTVVPPSVGGSAEQARRQVPGAGSGGGPHDAGLVGAAGFGPRAGPRPKRLVAWERWLSYFVVPLLVCGAFAGVVTVALVQASASDRRKLNDEFRLRTLDAGRLTESYVGTQESLMIARAEDLLSGRTIPRQNLRLALSGLGYQGGAAGDGSGRVLVNQPYIPNLIGQNFSSSLEHIRIAVQQNRPGSRRR